MLTCIFARQISKIINVKTIEGKFYFRIITREGMLFPRDGQLLCESQLSDDARVLLYQRAIEMADDVL